MRGLSRRVERLKPSGIREFFDLVQQGGDIVSLGVGEPDFATPWHIREHAIYLLEQGYTHYTSNAGILPLRKKISQVLAERFGVFYDPDMEILITTGTSEALDLALRAIIDEGDEVILPEPAYVAYRPCIELNGARCVSVDTSKSGFKVRAEDIEKAISPKTKAIILHYPNNPTGMTIDLIQLEKIAQIVKRHDLFVVSDEIYKDLLYDGRKHILFSSLPGMREYTILIDGFSKAYAMTGWRIGYLACPKEICQAIMKIHQYTMLCAPILSQYAALEALNNGYSQQRYMLEEYDKRRHLLVASLKELGLECAMPEGAFYVFVNIKNSGFENGYEFARALLLGAKVAVVPGGVFGNPGESYIRCSYATSIDSLKKAIDRIGDFLGSCTKN